MGAGGGGEEKRAGTTFSKGRGRVLKVREITIEIRSRFT